MSDEETPVADAATEATAAVAKAKKAPTEYEAVTMKTPNADGSPRIVQFPGKRKIQKTPIEGDDPGVQFDLRNGDSFTVLASQVNDKIKARLIAHGLAQKIGDEAAGIEDTDDISVAFEEQIKRLVAGEWGVAREAGDGFAGASMVIRAICEVNGKTPDAVKAFLQAKLDKSKADAAVTGAKPLTRNDLYASFRNPASKTGAVIERLEHEKKAKAVKVSADDLMNEMDAG